MIRILVGSEFRETPAREYGAPCMPRAICRAAAEAYLHRDVANGWKRMKQVLARNARRAGDGEGI